MYVLQVERVHVWPSSALCRLCSVIWMECVHTPGEQLPATGCRRNSQLLWCQCLDTITYSLIYPGTLVFLICTHIVCFVVTYCTHILQVHCMQPYVSRCTASPNSLYLQYALIQFTLLFHIALIYCGLGLHITPFMCKPLPSLCSCISYWSFQYWSLTWYN